VVKKIAEAKGANPGQVLIAWGMHGGHASTFPSSTLWPVDERKRRGRERTGVAAVHAPGDEDLTRVGALF
jgi:diketogulonate reductase-like aldo/keto reductase